MPLTVTEATRREYAARMNRVMDHIQANLTAPLELERLARVASFSPFHFHRLFHAWTGETLHDFVHRLRLERAAQRLAFDRRASITEIALDSGFSGSSPFARAFKKAFGVTASEWRTRKIGQTNRKAGQAPGKPVEEFWKLPRPTGRSSEDSMAPFPFDVRVRSIPAHTLAYLRQLGPHMGDDSLFQGLFAQLITWAKPRGLITSEPQLLSLIHDNPNLTPQAMQRWEAALVVPEGTPPDGPVGIQRLEGGDYATARGSVDSGHVSSVWDALLGDWLPGSGYQPDHRPALAFCLDTPAEAAEKKVELEIALPVRPV